MRGRFRPAKEWFHNYIFFNPKAFFILGLVLSHSFAEYAAMSTWIVYLTDNWKEQHLPKAAAIINLQDGVKIVLQLFLAYAADSCMGPMGRFKVVLYTTLAYILGLMLLWCSAKYLGPVGEIDMFYAAAVIIVVGMAGQEPTLRAFLADQLSDEKENPTEEKRKEKDEKEKDATENPTEEKQKEKDETENPTEEKKKEKDETENPTEEKKKENRTDILWRIARFSGATIVLVSLPNATWEMAFGVSALVMGATLLLFLLGYILSCYKPHEPDGSSSGIILRVLKAAIHNGQTSLLLKVPFLRRLDKAAVIDERTSPVSPEEQKEQVLPGHLCTAEEVREVKRLFTLIPIWICFLGCSLVAATGNTFFYEQTSNMDSYIADNEVPLKVLFTLRSIIRHIISYMFWSKKATQQHVTRMRIGVGMICSILCCIAAWQVEVHRLYLINEEMIDPIDSNRTISMSVLWLVPQFTLLGLMEGLASDGLHEFFYDHVATSMRSYGPSFSDCVLGFGYFISMPFVLLYRSWFKDSINTSHLDRYYLTLAILSFVCLVMYAYASYSLKPFHMGNASEDEELNESLEDQMGNASEGVELNEIKSDGNVDTTRSVSSSLRWRRKNVAKAAAAVRFSWRLKNKLAGKSPANADSPESTKEPLLQSHASTRAEEIVSDDKPGSLSYSERRRKVATVATATE